MAIVHVRDYRSDRFIKSLYSAVAAGWTGNVIETRACASIMHGCKARREAEPEADSCACALGT